MSRADSGPIKSQLDKIDSKEGLINQLQAVNQKVASKLASHEERVARLRKELMENALQYREDKGLWKKYAAIELQELCELYYKVKMKHYHMSIDIEIQYTEACQVKHDTLTQSSQSILQYLGKWSIEEVRKNVFQALEMAYSIRLPKDIIEKQDELKSIQLLCDEYSNEYLTLKQKSGGNHVDMIHRGVEVTKYLADIILIKKQFDMSTATNNNNSKEKRVVNDRLADMDEFVHGVLDEKKRRQIQSYVLDERVKEGTMCKKFCEKIAKNMKNLTLEEICEFIEGLIVHFSNESFHISKVFAGKNVADVQSLVKVLIYSCVFTYIPAIRDALHICLRGERGKQEYKQLKKVKGYAYFITKVDKCITAT